MPTTGTFTAPSSKFMQATERSNLEGKAIITEDGDVHLVSYNNTAYQRYDSVQIEKGGTVTIDAYFSYGTMVRPYVGEIKITVS